VISGIVQHFGRIQNWIVKSPDICPVSNWNWNQIFYTFLVFSLLFSRYCSITARRHLHLS